MEEELSKIFSVGAIIPEMVKKKGLEISLKEVLEYKTWKELSDFILLWEPFEIARHWCIVEFEMFERINLEEFSKGQGERPNISQMNERFNGIANWVRDALIFDEDPKKRLSVAKFFISILDNLCKLRNYQGVNEIVAPMNSAVINRLFNPELLSEDWPKLDHTEWGIFQRCSDICSHEGGFRIQRDLINRSDFGIPFLGLFQTDVIKIMVGNPSDGDESLTKMLELVSRSLSPITKFQKNTRYQFEKIPCLYEALRRIAQQNDFFQRKEVLTLSLRYKKRNQK